MRHPTRDENQEVVNGYEVFIECFAASGWSRSFRGLFIGYAGLENVGCGSWHRVPPSRGAT